MADTFRSPNPIPVFCGENHDFWSIKMKTYFCAQDLWDTVNNEYTFPYDISLADEYFPRIMGAKTAKEAWDKLQEEFQGNEKVNAFRSMMHEDMMVGAFSHSTAVGKLRQELPDVPTDARICLPRYNLDEANTVCHYYLRQRLVRRGAFTEENWKKIFYLSNGNGTEMRYLVPFMR